MPFSFWRTDKSISSTQLREWCQWQSAALSLQSDALLRKRAIWIEKENPRISSYSTCLTYQNQATFQFKGWDKTYCDSTISQPFSRFSYKWTCTEIIRTYNFIIKHDYQKQLTDGQLRYRFFSRHNNNHSCIIKWWPPCPSTHLHWRQQQRPVTRYASKTQKVELSILHEYTK